MSNKKKPKKLRRPNVPVMAGAGAPAPATAARPAGPDAAAAPRAPRVEMARPGFDYVYVKRDLKRISALGAIFVAALFALSLIIR